MGSDTHNRSGNNRATGQSVSELLGKIIEPVLARRTGMTLDLLTAWPDLAGPEFAGVTRPEKIDWPRRVHHEDPFEPATLVVACEGSAALFLQHDQQTILERVNLFFGFQAIKRIRIVQKSVRMIETTDATLSLDLSEAEEVRLKTLLETIDDPELRKTLERLGRGVLARSRQDAM